MNFSPPFLAGPTHLPVLLWQQALWLGTEDACWDLLSAEPQQVPPMLVLQAAVSNSFTSTLPTGSGSM